MHAETQSVHGFTYTINISANISCLYKNIKNACTIIVQCLNNIILCFYVNIFYALLHFLG